MSIRVPSSLVLSATLVLLAGCFSSGGALPEPIEHRAEREMCDSFREPGSMTEPGPVGDCASDADCTTGMNGRCLLGRGGGSCTYDLCFEDSDCPSGPCICGGDVAGNYCGRGDCEVDADCGDGGFCSPTFGSCGSFFGVEGFYCHTEDDECTDDADCEGAGAYCAYDPAVGHWACSTAACAG